MRHELEGKSVSKQILSARSKITRGAGLTIYGSPFVIKGADVVVNAFIRANNLSDLSSQFVHEKASYGVIALMVGATLAHVGVEQFIVGHAELTEALRLQGVRGELQSQEKNS